MNKKVRFNIEEELLAIIKIHNNKLHSTTKRIPRDIRDINDIYEIEVIKNNIKNTLSKKNKYLENIELNDFYVLDCNNIKITKNKISEKNNKKKKRYNNGNNNSKIPIKIIEQLDEDTNQIVIEIMKNSGDLQKGENYICLINLLEKVEKDLWVNLLN